MRLKTSERYALTVPVERIERSIHLIRGHKVILAADLAVLYGVVTRRLNEQVKRNKARFPNDFVFQLTPEEDRALTSQFAMSKIERGGRRTLPFAFTEHGAIMAAMVLKSPRAVEMSVQVVRAFVRLREMLASNAVLAHKLAELERKLEGHDHAIHNLFEAIRQLLAPPPKQKLRDTLLNAGGENGMVCGVGQVHGSGDPGGQRYAEAGEDVSGYGQCAGRED